MLEKIKAFLFKNTSTKQTVAKNTFWLTVSNFGGRIIKAVIVIYAARVLGTAGWGVASYALTLSGFLTIFIDPGINSILMREASYGDETKRVTYFSTTLFIKILLLFVCALVVIFVAPFFSLLPGAVVLLPLTALIIIFDGTREFLSSFIRSMEKMEWEAVIFVSENIAIVAFGIFLMVRSPVPYSFLLAYVLGAAASVFIAVYYLRSYLKKVFSFFSLKLIKPIFVTAWPFAISGALGLFFTSTDVLIISWLRSASDVGIYSAATRIVQTLYLIPGIIQYATLPLFARLAKKDDPKFRVALEQTLSMVFFASIPLSIGGIILGTPLMGLVFGSAYLPGGLSFEILMATLLFDFAASIVINALFAYDHQKSLIISSILGAAVNVGLDLLLIPIYGIAGSAVSTLFAQAVNNGYLWYAMKKINNFSVVSHLKKIIVAGAVMAVVTALLALLGVNVIVNIILSGAAYLLVLRALREPLLIEVKRLLVPAHVSSGENV
ncbi:MAG TPA: flippase [Candidatus Paceibacterota bacterium]|nr:flippase [Candidatus Paceibacterota bacterium]